MHIFKHHNLASELRPVVVILCLFVLILCFLAAGGTVRAHTGGWKSGAIHEDTNWGNVAGSRQTNHAMVPLNATNDLVFFGLMEQ